LKDFFKMEMQTKMLRAQGKKVSCVATRRVPKRTKVTCMQVKNLELTRALQRFFRSHFETTERIPAVRA